MIRRFKYWLMEKFLPAWAKMEMLAENNRLREQIRALETENKRLNTYIAGVQDTMRRQKKIIIYTGDKK